MDIHAECIDYTMNEAEVSIDNFRIKFRYPFAGRNVCGRRRIEVASKVWVDPATCAHIPTNYVPPDIFDAARTLAIEKMREARRHARETLERMHSGW